MFQSIVSGQLACPVGALGRRIFQGGRRDAVRPAAEQRNAYHGDNDAARCPCRPPALSPPAGDSAAALPILFLAADGVGALVVKITVV